MNIRKWFGSAQSGTHWDEVLLECNLLRAREEVMHLHKMEKLDAKRKGASCEYRQDYLEAWAAFRDAPSSEAAARLLDSAPHLLPIFERCSPKSIFKAFFSDRKPVAALTLF